MAATPTTGPKSTRSSYRVSSRCSSSSPRCPLARKQLEERRSSTPRSISSSLCLTRAQPLTIYTQCMWLAFTARRGPFRTACLQSLASPFPAGLCFCSLRPVRSACASCLARLPRQDISPFLPRDSAAAGKWTSSTCSPARTRASSSCSTIRITASSCTTTVLSRASVQWRLPLPC